MSLSRILVVGSGGREHALAWRLSRDPGTPQVLVAPGNEGLARAFRCLPIGEGDFVGMLSACRRERVELVVVGPETPLAAGLAEALERGGVMVFGPSAQAARLESSKAFAKEVMGDAGVATARAEWHAELPVARAALARFSPPYVVKADGLAAGKGVLVTPSRAEAEAFLSDCLVNGRLGAAGRRVLIEEHLEGEEASVLAVCDGTRHVLLPAARDYKRALDGDRGGNTGGMGALAPAPAWDAETESEVSQHIVEPMLDAMAARGATFRGVLYCGLMRTPTGPRVVEFNVRFGDPEAQVVLPLVEGDLGALLAGAAGGAIDPGRITPGVGAAVAVALVQQDYPESPRGEGRIENLDALPSDAGVTVFHAAATWRSGAWRIARGRAAYVTARSDSVREARAMAYRAIDRLGGTGWRCRRDIAAGVDGTAPGGPAGHERTVGRH